MMHRIARAVDDAHAFGFHRSNRSLDDARIAPLADIRNDLKKCHVRHPERSRGTAAMVELGGCPSTSSG
jgi:hypothetical protein